ncbi:MAG: ABC transporter permease [Lachnospiraceae bacterium]|uniref:ABC transporter permease n=1 Tax=Falcatimonas sp. MSJ-15 TaxID=2841515 RepID=UPI001C12079F|nr:ABC transporter permease [Falcatimonas sp. MSJ-15]MBQ5734123.1 ABC transporter permease [Lachnospiraceae bacterium]MBU5470452.1 ABC transporter permease [Falcatimonas sp. MSJ-15]
MKQKRKTEFFKKFRKHKLANVGLIIIIIEILMVTFLPIILGLDPYSIDSTGFNQAPCAKHILGTDDIGRDLFARVLYGGRVSLIVGICSTIISIIIGLPLGILAGYYRGIIENIVMRLADIFMSIPAMVLILVIVAVFEPSIITIIVVIGITGWTGVAKLIYGNVLSVRNKEYVEAARAIGTKDREIIMRYVLPNSIAPLWMSVAFRISQAIMTESGLSFLGAGIQSPQASWGNIIYAAQNLVVLTKRWWVWVPAGVLLMITIICINLVGEGIRDALDPKMKR